MTAVKYSSLDFICSDKNVLNLIVSSIAQLCVYTKNYCATHFKWVNCVVCELGPPVS